ncbi:MAG: DUF3794 domain-containing protein [Lachnospiraceae bacterium]|nr:DUF3794 domain-containing protein [Lachnospiraceae bacterium]
MELVKANLHMERSKCRINSQLTLEEDKTISDRNPDAEAILLEHTEMITEEIRPGKDVVLVRGKLAYELLIRSDEERGMYRLQGEIPFEEKIRAEGVDSPDQAEVSIQLEDFRTGLINSRKISIRALVCFNVSARQLYDEEIPIGLSDSQGLEVKREMVEQSVLAVEGKDILRIREELELPANLPAVQEVLWKSLELGKWELHPLEDSIGIQGEVHLFFLYEGEGEGRPVKQFSSTIPFSGNVECAGSRSGMLADIQPVVGSRNLAVKEDYDGEARMLELEMVLDLPIRLLENREWEMITDIYATSKEVLPEYLLGYRRIIRDKQQGRIKLSRIFSAAALPAKILQVCHVEGCLLPQETEMSEAGLSIEGVAAVSILCLTENEEKPYEVIRGEIPYSHLAESSVLTERSFWKVIPILENLKGTLLDGETIEIKAVVSLEILLGENWEQPTLNRVQTGPLSPEKINGLPGIVVYFADQEESLWDVGKRYMVSTDSIRSLNQLTSDSLQKGQKILLVKEAT